MIRLKLKELKKKVRRCWECSCYVRQVTTTEQAYELDTRRFGDRRYKKTWLKALCYYAVDSALVYDSPEALLLKLFSDIPYRGDEWALDHRQELLEALLATRYGPQLVAAGMRELAIRSESGDDESRTVGTTIMELVASKNALAEAGAQAQKLSPAI